MMHDDIPLPAVFVEYKTERNSSTIQEYYTAGRSKEPTMLYERLTKLAMKYTCAALETAEISLDDLPTPVKRVHAPSCAPCMNPSGDSCTTRQLQHSHQHYKVLYSFL